MKWHTFADCAPQPCHLLGSSLPIDEIVNAEPASVGRRYIGSQSSTAVDLGLPSSIVPRSFCTFGITRNDLTSSLVVVGSDVSQAPTWEACYPFAGAAAISLSVELQSNSTKKGWLEPFCPSRNWRQMRGGWVCNGPAPARRGSGRGCPRAYVKYK